MEVELSFFPVAAPCLGLGSLSWAPLPCARCAPNSHCPAQGSTALPQPLRHRLSPSLRCLRRGLAASPPCRQTDGQMDGCADTPGAVTKRLFLRAPPLPSQGQWFSSTAALFWQSPPPSSIFVLSKYTHLMSKSPCLRNSHWTILFLL